MNKDQFDTFPPGLIEDQPQHFDVNMLRDHTPRTLLYGYMSHYEKFGHDTFHVYLFDGRIHAFIYDNENGTEYHSERRMPVQHLLPHYKGDRWLKRLYPEACDFEFCYILRDVLRQNLPFTTYNEARIPARWYGKVYAGHALPEGAEAFNRTHR